MKLVHNKPLVDSMLHSIGRCIDTLKREEILVRTEEDEHAKESNEADPMYDPKYDLHMCARHEAGHFLTGHLLGVLPKAYSLPLPGKDGLCVRLRIGGAVKFIGFEFLREVPEGSMSTESVTSDRRKGSRPQEHQCNTKYLRTIPQVNPFLEDDSDRITSNVLFNGEDIQQFHVHCPGRFCHRETIIRTFRGLTRVIE